MQKQHAESPNPASAPSVPPYVKLHTSYSSGYSPLVIPVNTWCIYAHFIYIISSMHFFFIINKYVNRYIQWKYFQETTFSSYHNSFMRVLSFSCYKELQNIVHTHTQWPALAIPNFFSFSYLMSMDLASQMWNCLLKVLAKFKFGYILKNCLLNSFTI